MTDRAVDFVLHTGNAADNAQFNELRWFIDLSSARKEEVCEEPSLLLDPELTQEILADEETEVRAVTPGWRPPRPPVPASLRCPERL